MPPAFSEQELLDRVDNDIAFLADTVQMLDSDGRAILADVKKAALAGDAPAVARGAHTLKGMISNFCADEVQSLAFEVEKAGKAGDNAAAGASLERLEPALNSLIAELHAFVQARS